MRFYICAILVLSIIFSIPSVSSAGWTYLKDVHKSALSTALKNSPTEFRNQFVQYEQKLIDEVDNVHSANQSSWYSFQVLYKNIVKNIRENDTKRIDVTSRFLTDITIYLFVKYSPMKSYEYCNQPVLLKNAYVIYEGYEKAEDYSKMKNSDFEVSYRYADANTAQKELLFYNKLVNEIINLWISAWRDAGKSVAGLPQPQTLIYGSLPQRSTSKMTSVTPMQTSPPVTDSQALLFTDENLAKYRNSSDANNMTTDSAASALQYECDRLRSDMESIMREMPANINNMGALLKLKADFLIKKAEKDRKCLNPNDRQKEAQRVNRILKEEDAVHQKINAEQKKRFEEINGQGGPGCSFNTDCSVGYSCIKGGLYGVCVKH